MGLLEKTVASIGDLDEGSMAQARAHVDNLTKPLGSLGRLEELGILLAGIRGTLQPDTEHKVITTMAGDHGIAADGVSMFLTEVTQQMVYNFVTGGAGINVLARHVGARVVVVDMGVAADLEPQPGIINKKVGYGTASIARGPAMSREDAVRSLEAGIEVVEAELAQGLDILGTGDMGIGNTTPSSAIVSTITGAEVGLVTGRGTGLDDKALHRKIELINRALEVNPVDKTDGIDVLAKLGGYEIGGLAGAILGAAAHRRPVVIDGFISGAAALIAGTIAPKAKRYMVAAHNSVEIGHRVTMNHLGLVPLIDLNLRLGEGTGAALGITILESAAKILKEMASFGGAGVTEPIDRLEERQGSPAAEGSGS